MLAIKLDCYQIIHTKNNNPNKNRYALYRLNLFLVY
uniref:Uncharacterized protein n=1 Tax=Arundo donax TaxID=35708 RepID=A0A0A8ZKU7_ARUDO